jgi:hypothetical protein
VVRHACDQGGGWARGRMGEMWQSPCERGAAVAMQQVLNTDLAAMNVLSNNTRQHCRRRLRCMPHSLATHPPELSSLVAICLASMSLYWWRLLISSRPITSSSPALPASATCGRQAGRHMMGFDVLMYDMATTMQGHLLGLETNRCTRWCPQSPVTAPLLLLTSPPLLSLH